MEKLERVTENFGSLPICREPNRLELIAKLNEIVDYINKQEESKKIRIKYFSNEIDKIKKSSKGDLIDLRSAEDVKIKKGEFRLIKLGVGMKLPKNYKAHIYPRSSTCRDFGIIQANSVGQVDNIYSGNEDEWLFPAVAIRDTVIHKNDRICQFEIVRIQPDIIFEEVEDLDEVSRGGIGSSGLN